MNSRVSNTITYNGPQKRTAKVVDGAISRRPVLGSIQNSNLHRSNATSNLKDSKNIISKKQVGLKGSPIQKPKVGQAPAKENVVVEEVKAETSEPIKESGSVEDLSAAFSSQFLHVKDIDKDEDGNPQLVSAYAKDIYKYLWELETKYPIKMNFLDGHKVNGRMRAILIEWLVDVHARFSLLPETLYLTVAIIDRYLQINKDLIRDKLQLVGVSAMYIASKYEEMYIPDIQDFVYITDETFTDRQIRLMEIEILRTLNFFIGFPLQLHFLRRNSKAAEVNGQHHNLAKYLMELTITEYSFCHYKASQIAAAALYLSLKLLPYGIVWDEVLHCYSSYSEKQVSSLACKLASLVIRSFSSKQKAVRNKYKAAKFMKISELPQLSPTSKILKDMAAKASL